MWKKIVKNAVKPNHVVGGGGREIEAIKQSIGRMLTSIEFKLNQGYPRKKSTLRNNPTQPNPTQWLLCVCDRNAKDMLDKIEERENN